jgi:uncharacterized protein
MLVGFARYSRDRSFVVLGENKRLVLVMAAGFIVGSFIADRLLGLVPNGVPLPLVAARGSSRRVLRSSFPERQCLTRAPPT